MSSEDGALRFGKEEIFQRTAILLGDVVAKVAFRTVFKHKNPIDARVEAVHQFAEERMYTEAIERIRVSRHRVFRLSGAKNRVYA